MEVKEGSGDTKRLRHCCGPTEKSSKETERRTDYISLLLFSDLFLLERGCERTQDVTLPLYAVVTALLLFHKPSQTVSFRLLHIPVCVCVKVCLNLLCLNTWDDMITVKNQIAKKIH